MTSRGSGCREFVCHRGWSSVGTDDLQPVTGFAIAGIEAQGLAEEDGGGLVLVAARGELAEQPVRGSALRIETDDVAEVGLRIEIAAQCDVGARPDHEERHALRLFIECIGHQGDHPGVMASLEQLVCRRDDSSVHERGFSKGRAR
jgi:hypothetical protein